MSAYTKKDHGLRSSTDGTAYTPQYDYQDALGATWLFKRADNSGGGTVFTVEVSFDSITTSADDSTWYTYSRLITNATNTNSQTIVRVAGWSTGAADGTSIYSMSPEDKFIKVRGKAVRTTSGTNDIYCVIQYQNR